MIRGKEYLLAGRKSDKDSAGRESEVLRTEWMSVRVIKHHDFDYSRQKVSHQESILKMTLKQIRATFAVGEEWAAVNTYNPRASGSRVSV